MRVAELDMTNSSHQCPSGLRQRNDSNIRTCVRIEETRGCSSAEDFINSYGIEYTKVCGRIIGYQFGSPEAYNTGSSFDLSSHYVDGVSLTHDPPRQHIWTFAAARDEVSGYCPCGNTGQQSRAPSAFVGNDYFCDAGSTTYAGRIFYADNPLWDGAGCGPQSACCSFNNPPWFYKQLPQPTTNDIEMRVCRDYGPYTNEDIAIEVVEIYVQ
jgi:dynein heavy chain